MARVYGLGRFALFWRVILPGALPSILVGLRYALGIMWLTLIVAETISASSGIGYMTMNAREFLQTDVVLLGIIVYALLGKLADVLTRRIERTGARLAPGLSEPGARRQRLMTDAAALRRDEYRAVGADPRLRGHIRLAPEPQTAERRIERQGRHPRCRLEGLRRRGVLAEFDLTVPAGQFLAVVGRSGGGKSTLAPADRRARPADRRARSPSTASRSWRCQRSVRLLFQDARLLPWQRVIGNVGIARGRGWRDAALAALGDVGLADRADDWPAVLSGGQKQRVALARALVSRPGVLLLDEPFGALDALTRTEMHRLLDRIWGEHRFTTILITHDVAEAVALADRVVVLREGGVVLDLPVICARPRRRDGERRRRRRCRPAFSAEV